MTEQINGQLGDWASKCANAKPIEVSKKTSCLELFKQGIGYHRAARVLGLRPYTVRDWKRRFRAGDEAWATRVGRMFQHSSEARDLINYRHEIEAFVSGRGTDSARDGSGIRPEQSFRGREDQVAGGAEQAAPIPLYCADGACERILARGTCKKKEVAAVQSLTADGHTIKEACRIAGIPRCAYYRALKPTAKAESDAELVRLMCDIENDRLMRTKKPSSPFGRLVPPTGITERDSTKSIPPAGHLIDLALRYVRANPSADVADVARELRVSASLLRLRFRNTHGKILRDEILDARLSLAMQQLRTTAKPISRVAEDCGFASTSHLSHFLKSKTGHSPRDIRAKKETTVLT